ncbi:MAG TPA: SMP-30/gluconolactonase/LRE family protein [Gemmatimonadales bacterium]|nr:SMP-30/gluconolactonase/LRE family protein [Gemmatimonadales bacterium]
MRINSGCLALLLLLAPARAPAQAPAPGDHPIADARAQYRLAVQAYRARDYASFLEHARRARSLRPTHGGVTYALASAYALTGDTAAALACLRRFAAMGYVADVVADPDFTALHRSEALAEIGRRLRQNREPLVRGTVAFELPERDLLAEGVAYDPREGVFYVSAVHRRKIVRMAADGGISDFASLEGKDDGAPLGLRVDPVRRALWVTTAANPAMRGYSPVDSGRSALLRYDLATGRRSGSYPVPADGRAHVLGDLVIGRDGDIYTSDSRSPVIYRLEPGSDALAPLVESPLLVSAQGLALTPDERRLYVADYSAGILRVDLEQRVVAPVPAADTIAGLGIDGLYYVDGSLVGIQNGVEPSRVVRLRLTAAGDSIDAEEVLERAHPHHAEPTLGVVVGRELYYVANSQYQRFTQDGRVAEPDSLRRPVVLRLRL